MSVKNTSVHAKDDVSSGEAVDKKTRGPVLFGVDSKGIAYPIDVDAFGLLGVGASTELLSVFNDCLEELKMVRMHLNKITGLES